MEWKVPLADLDLGPEEEEAVLHVLRSKWLTMGKITRAFEDEFARHLGVQHAIAVTNCTAALHMACLATGLTVGDEVILPSLTFVATANAIRYTGATPIFADITSEDDLNISPQAIERAISERTRAILVVHYGGYSCDMPAITSLANKHNLFVIEDAAHAIGASLDGRALGTWGDIGCFSFFSNKNLATGEGGMVVTNNEKLAEKIKLLRSHGMTTLTWDRHTGRANKYDVVELGYNYRIDEIRSAIGHVQLGRLDANNQRRRQLTNLYRHRLGELGLHVPFSHHHGISAAHLLPLILPDKVDRTKFMGKMKTYKVQTSVHFPPIHHFSAYNSESAFSLQPLPVTENVASREVSLPLFPTLKEKEVAVVIQAVQDSLAQLW